MFKTFVPVDRISEPGVGFTWSDWDPYAAVGDPAADRIETLGGLSDRALVAYSVACAEWVVYRFSRLSSDQAPYLFLEALWVSGIDSRYRPPAESDESQWKGPIRGSIDLALMTTLNAISSTDGGKPEVDAALAEQIALHVCADKEPMRAWSARVLDRLARHFSRTGDVGRTLGLPPQVFGEDFNLADIDAYMESYLAAVDLSANPFIERF